MQTPEVSQQIYKRHSGNRKFLEKESITGRFDVLQEEPAFQEKSMQRRILRKIALRSFALVVVLGAVWQAQAQDAKAPYPSMAPLDQYLMERDADVKQS